MVQYLITNKILDTNLYFKYSKYSKILIVFNFTIINNILLIIKLFHLFNFIVITLISLLFHLMLEYSYLFY